MNYLVEAKEFQNLRSEVSFGRDKDHQTDHLGANGYLRDRIFGEVPSDCLSCPGGWHHIQVHMKMTNCTL